MSGTKTIYSVVKAIMLMNERFDAIDQRIKRLDGDLTDLGRSQLDLAQRVAVIEGYIRGRADQAAVQAQPHQIPG